MKDFTPVRKKVYVKISLLWVACVCRAEGLSQADYGGGGLGRIVINVRSDPVKEALFGFIRE